MHKETPRRRRDLPSMDASFLLDQLHALASQLSVTVRYESISSEQTASTGGLCRVGSRHLVLIDRRAPVLEQARVLAGALRAFDLSGIYLRPGVRAFLSHPRK